MLSDHSSLLQKLDVQIVVFFNAEATGGSMLGKTAARSTINTKIKTARGSEPAICMR
jgi:hypothetical protein